MYYKVTVQYTAVPDHLALPYPRSREVPRPRYSNSKELTTLRRHQYAQETPIRVFVQRGTTAGRT
jgi:hypothetical protein